MFFCRRSASRICGAEALAVPQYEQIPLENRLENLFETARMLADFQDLNLLLEHILTESQAVMECEAASMMLRVVGTDYLEFVTVRGKSASQLTQRRILIGEGISGQVAKTKKIANVKNAYEDPRFNPIFDEASGFKTRTILAAPLLFRETLVGVIVAINKKDDRIFDATDEKIFSIYSHQAAIAVNNAREKQRMEQRSQALSIFASEIGRTLATELTLIYGYAHQSKRNIYKLLEKLALNSSQDAELLGHPVLKIEQSAERLSNISKTLNIFNRSTEGLQVDVFALEEFASYFQKETKYHQVSIALLNDCAEELAFSMESLFLVIEALIERAISSAAGFKAQDLLLLLRHRVDFVDVCVCVSSNVFACHENVATCINESERLLSMAAVEAILDVVKAELIPNAVLCASKTNCLTLDAVKWLKNHTLLSEHTPQDQQAKPDNLSVEVLWQIVLPTTDPNLAKSKKIVSGA